MLLKILRSTMHLFIFFPGIFFVTVRNFITLICHRVVLCQEEWSESTKTKRLQNWSHFVESSEFNKKPNLSGIKRQTKWSVRCCGECAYIVHITISVNVLFHRDTISGIQTQGFFFRISYLYSDRISGVTIDEFMFTYI